ncbi:MAG: ABC transporter substrate-binding protein [Austwickia sp.]|jgi:peptide/nickel transport system substrate-binding protein|nr:ABC transporter substrate-binding protein [Austwickia sp.]MBK8435085.1 ABC transporter substrate-binding protein [Austwickia sp.]MBK9101361.1 ABC transporter substrate-binding protein [Austwickia sp.]
MRRSTSSVLAGTVTVAISLALAACSAGSGSTPSSASSGASGAGAQGLAVGLVLEPTSLDFTKADGAAISQAMLTNVYEGLVKTDQQGKIVPALATSWEVSPDRTTYTFELTDSAKFTNGQPFTADDAVFSINRVKTEWTPSVAKAMQVVASAKALSPTRLEVKLSKPSNDWLYRMTTRIGAMFSRTGVANLATTPVGTGPYTLKEWKRGDSLTLTRNENYWGAKPYFQNVTLKYIKDANALNNALLSGTINVIGVVTAPEALGQFSGNEKYQVIEGTTNGEVVLSMNNARAPFNNPLVRQAARHAIDHAALVKTCWGGKGTLIGSMVPPTDPWYEDLTGVAPYDVAKAKALLSQAKLPNPAVRLRVPVVPYATSCGQVVKSQLEGAGFTVTMDQLEFPTWLSDVFKNGDYEMSIVAHVEGRDLRNVFGNPDYYIHYTNPALQAVLAAADSGPEDQQVAKMREAARLISQDAASDWLFLLPNLMVAEKNITGLPTNAVTDALDLTRIGRS